MYLFFLKYSLSHVWQIIKGTGLLSRLSETNTVNRNTGHLDPQDQKIEKWSYINLLPTRRGVSQQIGGYF